MLLQVSSLRKSFGTGNQATVILDDLGFDLDAGQTLALTGESGSGKSTLLHIVGGLEEADGGSVLLHGSDVTKMDDGARAAIRRRSIGIVFQQFNLIPSLDTEANISFQARLSGGVDAGWISELTDRLGLTAHTDKYPEQLSGGQQQRVAIGRALAAKPDLLLADEPTGNLDEATGNAVMDLMLDLVADAGIALLMVTHSDRMAARLGTRLTLRQGRIA